MFAIIFACFGAVHFAQAFQLYPHFEWQKYDGKDIFMSFANLEARETLLNVKKFIAEWNQYIEQQSRSSRRINLIAGIAYLFTSLMAFVSMLLPGPYNIKDIANCLYSKSTNSSIYKTYKRKFKKGIKSNDHNECDKTGGPN